ncbi:MAG: hypothetical protein ACTS8S_21830 [Giesbergeria sp.]
MDGLQRAELLQNGDFAKLDEEVAALMRQTGNAGRTGLHRLRDLAELFQLSGRETKLFGA